MENNPLVVGIILFHFGCLVNMNLLKSRVKFCLIKGVEMQKSFHRGFSIQTVSVQIQSHVNLNSNVGKRMVDQTREN